MRKEFFNFVPLVNSKKQIFTFIGYIVFLLLFSISQIYAEIPIEGETLTLERMIGIAVCNNPRTKATWAGAWYSYWNYKQTLSTNDPHLDYIGIADYNRRSIQGEGNSSTLTTYNQDLLLTYLVFDFGVRAATQSSAYFDYVSADFLRDWTVQDVILDTVEAYTDYINAVETIRAREADLADTKLNFEVAQAHYEAGIKNISDALQAKSEYVNNELLLEVARGNEKVAMSNLKTVLALPMMLSIHPQELSPDFAPSEIVFHMDQLLDKAQTQRSDLWSSYALVLEKEQGLQRARADGWPRLNFEWTVGRRSGLTPKENYHTQGALILTAPLYHGYYYERGIRKAYFDLEEQKAFYKEASLNASLDVATNYYNFNTAYKTYMFSVELLSYAEKTYEVTLANYKAGIGGFDDLFNAQGTLTNARNSYIQTKTAWILSLARLIHAIGMLRGDKPLLNPHSKGDFNVQIGNAINKKE